jgi:hypothetical protein
MRNRRDAIGDANGKFCDARSVIGDVRKRSHRPLRRLHSFVSIRGRPYSVAE